MKTRPTADKLSRRRALERLLKGGAGAAALSGSAALGAGGAAAAEGEGTGVTAARIRRCEWLPGLDFSHEERALMLQGVETTLEGFAKMRAVPLDNSVAPPLRYDPEAVAVRRTPAVSRGRARWDDRGAEKRPASDEDVAFAPIPVLARLLRSRQISSVELTRLYLDRLRRFDPTLKCVVTLTEELALEQAERADRELAAGRPRGPLHGIPWGAKDLLAVPGYPTTWGSVPYREQRRRETATVVRRLEEAGAVLVAKLSVGELAWGDVWFGGMTRNPWRTEQGASGSSAGSASAVAAGLVGFAIGTETWGSIVSPCTRCGASGLRPTFGRVSRHGAMALSWSMDKIGPIARTAEDCALVFAAIHGADPLDPTAIDRPFEWPRPGGIRSLRIGYTEALFDADYTKWAEEEGEKTYMREWAEIDRRALEALRGIGIDLIPIRLPESLPVAALDVILTAEAACLFDELTRSGRDELMVRQTSDAWPNVFRQGQLIPAVEYLRANRIRTLLMQEMDRLMKQVDVYVVPSFGGDNLLITNLTGHPAAVVPNGFVSSSGTPTSITFQGRLHGEAEVLALARAFQRQSRFHLRRPPL
jgi:Asp-tRNA(Asn)/Glu-tRNA(Gln) amidotransferase A subunit family amidase